MEASDLISTLRPPRIVHDHIAKRAPNMPRDLPDDILQLIFSFLRPSPQSEYWHGCTADIALLHRTLAAAARTSKMCQRLATPLLYETVQVYSKPRYSHAELELSGIDSNSSLLIESFLGREVGSNDAKPTNSSRPPLARLVKHLSIEWIELLPPEVTERCRVEMEAFLEKGGERPYLGDTWQPKGIDGMPEDLHQGLDWQIYDAVEDAKLGDETIWHLGDAYATGVEDAAVAMILLLCRDSLQTLDLPAVPGVRHSLVMDVIEGLLEAHEQSTKLTESPPFYKLHQLSVRGENSPHGHSTYRFSDLEPALRLPSLTTLRCHGMQCLSKRNSTRLYESIQKIELVGGLLNPDGVEDVLRSCPNLTELSVSDERAGEDEMDMIGLGQQLSRHGRQLTSLVLNIGSSTRESMPPLKELKSLRHLGVRHIVLLGPTCESKDMNEDARPDRSLDMTEVLPVSLEVLEMLAVGEYDRAWCQVQDSKKVIKLLGDTDFRYLREVKIQMAEDEFTSTEHLTLMGWAKSARDGMVSLNKSRSSGRDRFDSVLGVKLEPQKTLPDVEPIKSGETQQHNAEVSSTEK